MIKYILATLIILMVPLQAYSDDAKGSALTRITSATSDDLIYVVDDPDGTPASRAITKENFLSGYIMSSALTTILSDYVLSSALATTLADYVLTSALATATVKTAGELSPTKESGVPGYSYWFEADTTNELTSGFQGPDDLSVNISYKLPDAAGTNGQVLIGGTPSESQTLPDGRTGTIVPLSWGDITGGSAPTFQDTDPAVSAASGFYQNRTDGGLFLVEHNVAVSVVAMSRTPWWLLTGQDPGNANVISSDGTIDCGDGATDCTQYLTNNATPTLTATAASGYEFLAWTGDATDTSTTTNPDTITMDSAKTIGATFNLLPTLDSGAIMSVANQIVLPFTEALTIGSGGSGGIVVTGSVTGASNGTYLSGNTTAEFTFLTADDFQSGETITVAYTQPTDGLEDSDGGDLASFSGESVTNSIGAGACASGSSVSSDETYTSGTGLGGPPRGNSITIPSDGNYRRLYVGLAGTITSPVVRFRLNNADLTGLSNTDLTYDSTAGSIQWYYVDLGPLAASTSDILYYGVLDTSSAYITFHTVGSGGLSLTSSLTPWDMNAESDTKTYNYILEKCD